MADLKEKSIALLASVSGIDMKTATTKRTLFTVPAGKTAFIVQVNVRAPSATLAGGTSYAFGGTATCNDWKTAVDLSSMTTANTDAIQIVPATKFTLQVAGTVFGMYITTGSTGAATATIEVMGYLY